MECCRDKPAVASNGEINSALYNQACCHSKLGNVNDGLVCLAKCFEQGYEGFQQAQTDPDLATLQQDPKFTQLIQRYGKVKRSSFLSGLMDNLRNPIQ